MNRSSVVAAVILGFVSIAHLLRLLFQVEITADGVVIPMWVSVIGCVVSAGVALWLWRDRAKG